MVFYKHQENILLHKTRVSLWVGILNVTKAKNNDT